MHALYILLGVLEGMLECIFMHALCFCLHSRYCVTFSNISSLHDTIQSNFLLQPHCVGGFLPQIANAHLWKSAHYLEHAVICSCSTLKEDFRSLSNPAF